MFPCPTDNCPKPVPPVTLSSPSPELRATTAATPVTAMLPWPASTPTDSRLDLHGVATVAVLVGRSFRNSYV
jgi:hypothetical protein